MNAVGLDQLHLNHLQTLMRRTDRVLADTGFEAVVIHAGNPPTQFLDDQDYPYKVNPHFKAWVPVLDNPRSLLVYRPGRAPQLLFYQPDDYWHKPASLPDDPWTEAIEVIPMPDPSRAQEVWSGLRSVAFIGSRNCFPEAAAESVNPPELLSAPSLRAGGENPLRTRVPTPRHGSGGARATEPH